MTALIRSEALRFLIAGAINTAVTYVIYLALLTPLGYTLAYTVAYIAGIALAYTLNTRFVFRVRQRVREMLLFPLVYAFQYLIGVVTLQLAINQLGIPQKLALLASIGVTIPVTFLLSRFVLKSRSGSTLA
jgi:putative flippase GtrA